MLKKLRDLICKCLFGVPEPSAVYLLTRVHNETTRLVVIAAYREIDMATHRSNALQAEVQDNSHSYIVIPVTLL